MKCCFPGFFSIYANFIITVGEEGQPRSRIKNADMVQCMKLVSENRPSNSPTSHTRVLVIITPQALVPRGTRCFKEPPNTRDVGNVHGFWGTSLQQ